MVGTAGGCLRWPTGWAKGRPSPLARLPSLHGAGRASLSPAGLCPPGLPMGQGQRPGQSQLFMKMAGGEDTFGAPPPRVSLWAPAKGGGKLGFCGCLGVPCPTANLPPPAPLLAAGKGQFCFISLLLFSCCAPSDPERHLGPFVPRGEISGDFDPRHQTGTKLELRGGGDASVPRVAPSSN